MKKELYRFVEGDNVWTVTSSDESQVYNSENYTHVAIGRNEVESKNEISRANIEVSVDIDNEMGRRWLRQIIDNVVTLTIFNYEYEDEEENVLVIWKGRLVTVKPEVSEIVLIFESIFTSLRRPGLRKKYQRSCPHTLYQNGCFVNKENWKVFGTVDNLSSNGVVLTIPEADGFPDGYFTAGMIEAPDGTFRFITKHQGSTIVLVRPVYSLSQAFQSNGYGFSYGNFYGGLSLFLYPGCDRTKETCKGKFNNLPNHGGFPFIPLKNPFGGGSIV